MAIDIPRLNAELEPNRRTQGIDPDILKALRKGYAEYLPAGAAPTSEPPPTCADAETIIAKADVCSRRCFDASNRRYYAWKSAHLRRFGGSIDTAKLVRHLLGRPVAPDALSTELKRDRLTECFRQAPR